MMNSKVELEPGYYWVRSGDDWEVAAWDGEQWWMTGNDFPVQEATLIEIDPRRLVRPDEVK